MVAAGNEQSAISYPGNLPEILTVGASNQWDQRKTMTSKDGEDWWGSNFGVGLDLMAPGVSILTTDISGPRGYSRTRTTPTSTARPSATPFVAAAAALVLSVRPGLDEADVRRILVETTDHIGPGEGPDQVRRARPAQRVRGRARGETEIARVAGRGHVLLGRWAQGPARGVVGRRDRPGLRRRPARRVLAGERCGTAGAG